MSLSPRRARVAAGLFAAVALAVTVNVLFLQGDADSRASMRASSERAQQHAEIERRRRLALKADEVPAGRGPAAPSPAAGAARPQAPELTPAQIERIGRFAPSASRIGAARIPETDAEARAIEIVRAVQRRLAERGYEPGAADGVAGTVTRAAVMAYEHDHGLPLTAEPSEHVLGHLETGLPPAAQGASRAGKPGRMPHAEQLVRSVQQSLSTLGYFVGRIDGFAGDDTVRAIREYEMDAGLVPTGRVSGPLISRLSRSTTTAGPRTGAR